MAHVLSYLSYFYHFSRKCDGSKLHAFKKITVLAIFLNQGITAQCHKERLTQNPPKISLLDSSQVAAVQAVLSHEVCLIQGPPGTGKTRTAKAIVDLLMRTTPWIGPVLLIAQRNYALDEVLNRSLEKGWRGEICRIGQRRGLDGSEIKTLKECRDELLKDPDETAKDLRRQYFWLFNAYQKKTEGWGRGHANLPIRRRTEDPGVCATTSAVFRPVFLPDPEFSL